MKPGDAVIAIKHIKANNPNTPECGRVIPMGYIDIVVTVNTDGHLGLQNDKDPAGYFWHKNNFRKLADSEELDTVIRELELSILN